MKKPSRKQLMAIGAGIVLLLLVVLLLLLFFRETERDRAKELYPSVEMAEGYNGTDSSLIAKPEGYPDEVGGTLAMMMSLHKDDASYLYHVAFRDGEAGDASTKDSIAKRLKDADALYVEEWVEIPTGPSQSGGWQYFLFTAEEIRTLAKAGIECRFVGSGVGLSGDGTASMSWEQKMERLCQWIGDSFRAKAGEQ